jgi:hypothetical protein
VLNCALHGGLIRRCIAYPTKKISFAHPPSTGSFHDQIFVCFSILCSPSQLGFYRDVLVARGFEMFTSEVVAKMILMGHPVSSCHVPVVFHLVPYFKIVLNIL